MKSICVFCGANPGTDPRYAQAAFETGRTLAERGITLVFGGGKVGLMGATADGALSAGGRVVGVIPDFLRSRELSHPGVEEMIITQTMHQRKQRMAELSEGFIALPGGLGSMDELFEILTWAQLELHSCPVGLLNVSGYYDPLLAMLDRMREEGFLNPVNRGLLLASDSLDPLLAQMEARAAAGKASGGHLSRS